jgi:hypothetical protein
MLRHVVALESAVPLLVVAVLSTATGFLAAGLFLKAQLSESIVAPSGEYYVIIVAGLVASLASLPQPSPCSSG